MKYWAGMLAISAGLMGSPAFAQYQVGTPAAVNPAGMAGVQLTQMEERLRDLQGQLEEANYRNKQLEAKLEKLQQDMDFRLQDMEKKLESLPASTTATPAADTHDVIDARTLDEDTTTQTTSSSATTTPSSPTPTDKKLAPSEQYNQAFRLLNKTKYEEARVAFKQFINDHPKSALISNAYYWMGETYYVKRDYLQAANAFRNGYQNNKGGSKAADNLLKLAMSLAALDKKTEACVVLKQTVKDFKDKNASSVAKANSEMKRLECGE